jgi:hypothetical protein
MKVFNYQMCMFCIRPAFRCDNCNGRFCHDHGIFHEKFLCSNDKRVRRQLALKMILAAHGSELICLAGYTPVGTVQYTNHDYNNPRSWFLGTPNQCYFCKRRAPFKGTLGKKEWHYAFCLECGQMCKKTLLCTQECVEIYKTILWLFLRMAKRLVHNDLKRHVWEKYVKIHYCSGCYKKKQKKK